MMKNIILVKRQWFFCIVAFLFGCESKDESDDADTGQYSIRFHRIDEFNNVVLNISGGTCATCWREMKIKSDSSFILSDESGYSHHSLSEEDMRAFFDLVLGEDFQKEMAYPEWWHCELDFDLENNISVEWSDETQEALLSDGCLGRCDRPDHPYMRLKKMMMNLKDKYLSCPTKTDPYACTLAPEPPPRPLGIRMLCAVCEEDC